MRNMVFTLFRRLVALFNSSCSISNILGTYNVTAPSPYDAFHPNDTLVVKWTITQNGLPRLAEMNIFLVPNNASININYTVGLNTAKGIENMQYWDYTIPSNITPGVYELVFESRERQSNLLITNDAVHIPIVIKPGTQGTRPKATSAGHCLASPLPFIKEIFVMLLPNLDGSLINVEFVLKRLPFCFLLLFALSLHS